MMGGRARVLSWLLERLSCWRFLRKEKVEVSEMESPLPGRESDEPLLSNPSREVWSMLVN
jgi:hypothetical protein